MGMIDQNKLYKDLETKSFKPVYFLFGDEPYLLEKTIPWFKFSVLDESTMDFNFSQFYAGEADVQQIKEAVETLPVFSPQRLVILRNAHDMKDQELLEFESLLKNPVDSTVFVVYAEKFDRRKRPYKNFLDLATCIEYKKPFDNQLPQWIRTIAQDFGLTLSTEAIHRIHRLVGNNLREIENQMGKIKEFIGARNQVNVEDVNQVVSVSREESVFDFTNAVGQKDRVRALEQLVSLMDQGQNEIGIVYLLARHMRILLTVRAGMDQGIGGTKLAHLANVPPYFIESYCDQARLWPVRKIEEAITVLCETDKALKSSPTSSHIWLENMVLKSCDL